MLRPVVVDPTRSCLDLDIPVIVACLCEMFAWFVDLRVLMRTAPKWFDLAQRISVVIQCAACFSLYIWFESTVCPVAVFVTMLGSTSWLIAGMLNFKISTYEVEPELDLKASIARAHYRD